MRRLSVAEVHARKVSELGLDPARFDLSSVEAIAAALRRAAGYLCPAAELTLVREVVRPLRGLVGDLETHRRTVEETLEAMIAYGDLVESDDFASSEQPGVGPLLLYTAPPGFVLRASGAAMLLGVAPDQLSALSEETEARIEYANHVRRITARPREDLRRELLQLGLVEVAREAWLRAPPPTTAAEHLRHLDGLLDRIEPSRDVPGLSLLDPGRSVGYYRGRWVDANSQSGRFVARRHQAYGASRWCYVQVRNGHPERLIDLPVAGSRWRGCDEAWHLQMSIDAVLGHPQRFVVQAGSDGTVAFQLYSPVPMWAKRRWDAIGQSTPAVGCLLSYRLPEPEANEERGFAREMLWLDEMA